MLTLKQIEESGRFTEEYGTGRDEDEQEEISKHRRYSICPRCEKAVRICKNERLAVHKLKRAYRNQHQRLDRCPGSGSEVGGDGR